MPEEFLIPHADPVADVESSLHGLFVDIFSEEGARSHFGFSRISPQHSDAGLPGWYLWFDEKHGAYGIFVTEAVSQNVRSGDTNTIPEIAARLRIDYYPGPDETVFEDFSWFEKILRMSAIFDATGTPTLEGGDALDEGFFTVGHADMRIRSHSGIVEAVLTAPEIWSDLRPDGLELADPDGKPFQAVNPGEKDRNVPGWELSSFLFDKLLAGYLYCQGRSPDAASLYEFDMPEFSVSSDNCVEAVFVAGLKGYDLQVIFENDEGSLPDTRIRDDDMGWRDSLPAIDYCHERRFLKTWHNFSPDIAKMGFSDWWAVKDLHIHSHEGHLCSCYTDEH